MNNIELIISLVTSAFAGGWLTRIITLRSERKKATAEADKMTSDNWRELAEKLEQRMNTLDARVQAQTEVIMMTFNCRLLMQNPDEGCPVQKAFHSLREDKEVGDD